MQDVLNGLPCIFTVRQKLTIPNNVRTYQELKDKFKQKENACGKIAQQFLDDAGEEKPKITIEFKDHDDIKHCLEIFKFFSDNNLLKEASNMYRKFNRWVNEQNERINEKRYESASNKLLRGQKEWDEATAIFVDNMDILDQHNAHLKYDLIVK